MPENSTGCYRPRKIITSFEAEEQRLDGHGGMVYSVCWSPDGTRLASAAGDKTVRIWNVKTGQEEQCLKGHANWVSSVNWSPDGTRLASASYDHTVRIWNGSTGQEEQRLDGHGGMVYSVCWS
nr:hypothetical protein [Planctomycetia bacterium]